MAGQERDGNEGHVDFEQSIIGGIDTSAALVVEGKELTPYPDNNLHEGVEGASGLDLLVQNFNLWVRSVDSPR